MRTLSLSPLLVACALGCGGTSDDKVSDTSGGDTDTTPDTTDSDTTPMITDCTADGPTVAVGTGEFAYTPLAEGDPVLIVKGGQGGWHIDTAGHVSGSSDAVFVVPTVTWINGDEEVQIAGIDQQQTVLFLAGYDDETCSGDFFAVRAFVDDYTPDMYFQQFVCSLEGQQLRIDLQVEDFETGNVTTASLLTTAMPDPASNDCD